MPKIVQAVAIEDDLHEKLAAAGEVAVVPPGSPRADLIAACEGADGILLNPIIKVDEELLNAAPELKVAATTSVGFDAFDVPFLTEHGVALCNTPRVLNNAVADLTIALMLMLSRGLMQFEAYSRSGAWGRREPQPPLAHDPQGKTLGIIGFGRIGREVARRASAFDMNLIWYDVFDQAPADAPAAERVEMDDLLRAADFVTVHTDLNNSSRHVIGARELSLMKPSAYLINTSRGPTVDQKALQAALESGQIAGAGLDVLEREPPDPDEEIVKLPNAITFPHIGTATEETRRFMREMAVENLISVLEGREPPAIVNPAVLG